MKYCVIGLGIFGTNLARILTQLGAEVLAVDRDPDRVDELKDEVAHALIMDAGDAKALRQLPLSEMDGVIVAIGEDFESSILATAHLHEMGIPNLICRSINATHGRLLELMKVPKIILPERMAADRTARSLMLGRVNDAVAISADFDIVELPLPERLAGRSLQDAALRHRYRLNLITIKRPSPSSTPELPRFDVLGIIPPDHVFDPQDILLLFGKESDIRRFLQD
jgi:trk system potassium uptake protein TrkA